MDDRPIALQGAFIALAPLIPDDVALLERWMSDLDVTTAFGYFGESTSPGGKADWYRQVQASTNKHFAILRNGACIGRCAIFGINHRHQHAEYGIMIGDKSQWGHGYGTEATRLMADYAFRLLGLRNLFLWVYGYNARAYRAYQKAGYTEAGRMRHWIYVNEQWHDAIIMQCDRESWLAAGQGSSY